MSRFSSVGLPTTIGPCLISFLAVCMRMIHSVKKSDETEVDTSHIPRQRRVVNLASLLASVTLSIKILVAEAVFSDVETENTYLLGLMVTIITKAICKRYLSCQIKYVLGSADLLLTPLIVALADSEIRQGIIFLFRRKRERPGTGYLR